MKKTIIMFDSQSSAAKHTISRTVAAIEGAKRRIDDDRDLLEGLQTAIRLISETIPDLENALHTVHSALDDASSVIDPYDDEEYAYQTEFEAGKATLDRLASLDADKAS